MESQDFILGCYELSRWDKVSEPEFNFPGNSYGSLEMAV